MDKVELPVLKGKSSQKYIPMTVIVGIVILVVLLLITSLSLTIKKTYKINYSDSSDLDYKVYLKPNDYFESKYLGKQKQYISTLIDYVDADFTYRFSSDDDIDIDYEYYILANLVITNTDGKTINEKKEYLLSTKKVTAENNRLSVNENVKIDYDKYNQWAKEFIETYKLTANANLIVSLNVDVKGSKKEFDKTVSDRGVITLNIPLTTKTVDISMDYELSNNKNAVLQYSEAIIKNKTLFTGGIAFIVLDIIGIISIIAYIIINRDEQERYRVALNKILRDNERYISETIITERVEDMMKTRSLRIEVVKTFNSLMDIRDSLNKPILYHEEKHGEQAVFYIISERVGYIYVMSVEDFIKTKKK
ncbi:MAG: hypothetical protein J1F35_02060 [Erysipelotrichales bacterium]|nr:hypothetical protein [Erysipelotrichales bacterium]